MDTKALFYFRDLKELGMSMIKPWTGRRRRDDGWRDVQFGGD